MIFLSSYPLSSLWKNRSSIFHFAVLNIKVRYSSTQLGIIWAVLEPIFYFLMLYVVFSTIRQREPDFAIYLLSGVIIYHIFQRGTTNGINSLTKNSGIIQSLNINKEIFPAIATVATGLLSFVHVAVFFALMPVFQFVPGWTIILLPFLIFLLLILIMGMNYILSIVNVYLRDVKHLWLILVHSLLFISPIFWRVDEVDGVLLVIHKMNPLGQLIEISHSLVVGKEIPPLYDWIYTSVFIFSIFIIGFIIFHKYEKKVVEEI